MNSDLIDLLRILNENQVKYLIAGAYAVIHFTEPRYTKDLAIWIKPSVENSQRVWGALIKFGAPLENVKVEDFQDPENIFQIGIAPNRIDILMGIEDVDFDKAWKSSLLVEYGAVKAHVMNIDDLIASKQNTGRLQDQIDIEKLEKAKKYNQKK